jgi:hypothetical protein
MYFRLPVSTTVRILCLDSWSSQRAPCAAPRQRPIWRILGVSLASAKERTDGRAHRILSADVLALEGEDENAIRDGVRVALTDYEQIFRAQEVNKRMKDKAAHACHALCRARVVEEIRRWKGTATADHLKLVLNVIEGPRFLQKDG